jgi:hypothetical protein
MICRAKAENQRYPNPIALQHSDGSCRIRLYPGQHCSPKNLKVFRLPRRNGRLAIRDAKTHNHQTVNETSGLPQW